MRNGNAGAAVPSYAGTLAQIKAAAEDDEDRKQGAKSADGDDDAEDADDKEQKSKKSGSKKADGKKARTKKSKGRAEDDEDTSDEEEASDDADDEDASDAEDDEQASVQGKASARLAERRRCGAILTSQHALGRESLAIKLAFGTSMSASDAVAVLKTAPEGRAQTRGGLSDRMAGVAQPRIGAGGGGGDGAGDKSAGAMVLGVFNRINGKGRAHA